MPHSNNLCYQFGPYHLDLSNRILTCNGEIISLTPKATEILIMLVKQAGKLVEKDELLARIWADTFVEEANLTQNIFLLRRALGDDRTGPRYIETVARRGYRFVGPVRVFDPAQNGSALAASIEPVVAVLPFLNSTGDRELEYLAGGLTDNIINNLSRVSKLRVMSRSTVFRYRSKDADPRLSGRELGANVVLVGKINARASGLTIGVELVEVTTGWQLWGESFDSENKDLLQIQEVITKQLLAALKLKLTGEEERQVTARYTDNAEAYQSYLEGRYHWSRYTKKGIEKAIQHFRRAIELDPNYALAYAAIVDCYLRLATNYLPLDDDVPIPSLEMRYPANSVSVGPKEFDSRVRLRFEWDWKGAQRELRRANELKTNYPSALQWHTAYKAAQRLYKESCTSNCSEDPSSTDHIYCDLRQRLSIQITSIDLTISERVQVCCAIGRDQIDIGNCDAACRILSPWWLFGSWPTLDGLNQQCCADLLFTTGKLASFIANTKQLPRGQRHAQELLNGSIALFEQLGFRRSAAEGRIELAHCYYREGLFDIGRSTLVRVLDDLSQEDVELRSLSLTRLASLERDSGRLKDALARLMEAATMVEEAGPWTTARWYIEIASTYKDLAVSEIMMSHFAQAKDFYFKALYEFQAVGHHRYVAVVENNIGLLHLSVGAIEEAEKYLLHSRKVFESFSDSFRGAQVDETLARLYIETKQYDLAQQVIERAIGTLEQTDGEAYLAEALTTAGIVAVRQVRHVEAKKNFEAAYNVAERCGDIERAGLSLLIMFEEMGDQLGDLEKVEILKTLQKRFATTQQKALQARVENSLSSMPRSSQGED